MSELMSMTIGHTIIVMLFYSFCFFLFSGIPIGLSLKYSEDNDEAFMYIFAGTLISFCLAAGPTYLLCKALGYFQ